MKDPLLFFLLLWAAVFTIALLFSLHHRRTDPLNFSIGECLLLSTILSLGFTTVISAIFLFYAVIISVAF